MVILSLILVFFLSLGYREYNRINTYSEVSSRMAQFLHSFRAYRSGPSEQSAVNYLKIRNCMMLKVIDDYYEAQFNPEFTTYTFTRVYTRRPTYRSHDKTEV